jgi:tRNA A37 threonylcarbamoyladenosine biosynthesis protein TsaE
VEWPEKAADQLPIADVAIKIVANMDESRAITVTAQTPLGHQVISKLQSFVSPA